MSALLEAYRGQLKSFSRRGGGYQIGVPGIAGVIPTGETDSGVGGYLHPMLEGIVSYAGSGTGALANVVILAPTSSTRNLVQPTGDFKNLVLKSFAGQTAVHLEGQDSAGALQWSIGPTGAGTLASMALTTPLPATSGGTGANTYTLGDTLYSSAANTLAKLAGNTTATKKFLRQTGNGSVSAAPAWDTLVAADVPGSALTRVDDTNVTLTLGGTPTTALLAAASLTLGWTGQLAISRGGHGQATAAAGFNALSPLTALGDVLYGAASGAGTRLAGNTTTTRKFLRQTGDGADSAAPAWDTLLAGDLPGGFSGFANPTGTIGLSAVNGSAATAMRSDGAPALSQAITPDWSGIHSFQKAITWSDTAGVSATASIWRDASNGLNVRGINGSTNALSLLAADGTIILRNPQGTTGITLVTATTLTALAGADTRFVRASSAGLLSASNIVAADLPGSFAGFANPTATIGLTVVNGSAATAMRSDGAPALSEAIVPTWSGVHTFSATPVCSANLQVNGRAAFGPGGFGSDTAFNFSGVVTGLSGTTNYAIISDVTFPTSATASIMGARVLVRTTASAYTVTEATGIRIYDAAKGAGSTITTLYGLKIESQTAGGTNYTIHTGTGSVLLGSLTGADTRFVRASSAGLLSASNIVAADLPGSFAGFANPSVSIGITATNGSAATAMRSDAAPALSQAITPDWSGIHSFQKAITWSDTAGVSATASIWRDAANGMNFRGIDGSTNAYSLRAADGTLILRNPRLTSNMEFPTGTVTVLGTLGVGAAPSVNLHVQKSESGGSVRAVVENLSNTASSSAFYTATVAGTSGGDAYYRATITGGVTWTWGADNSDSDAFVLSEDATLGSSNRLRVASGGNVGIGVNTGGGKLHISSEGGSASIAYLQYAETAITGPYAMFSKSRGTLASPTQTADTDILGEMIVVAHTGAGGFKQSGKLSFVQNGSFSASIAPASKFVVALEEGGQDALTVRFQVWDDGSFGFNYLANASGRGTLAIGDAETVPGSNPSGGHYLYSEAGALKGRGSSGTVTTIANAEPHCPSCGADYMQEYDNIKYGHFAICLKCLADEIGDRKWIIREPSRMAA